MAQDTQQSAKLTAKKRAFEGDLARAVDAAAKGGLGLKQIKGRLQAAVFLVNVLQAFEQMKINVQPDSAA